MKNNRKFWMAALSLSLLCLPGQTAITRYRQADGDAQIPCGFGTDDAFYFEGRSVEWEGTPGLPPLTEWIPNRMLQALPGAMCTNNCGGTDVCFPWVTIVVTYDYTAGTVTADPNGGWWVEIKWSGMVKYSCDCYLKGITPVDPTYVPF